MFECKGVAVYPERQGIGLGKAIVSRLRDLSARHKKIILYANSQNKESFMKLKVASIQMGSIINGIDENLRAAERHIDEVSKAGAKLVLLPELLPTGYGWTKAFWEAAEPTKGKTVEWMCNVSKTYGIYLGTTYLEACGGDFYNTFVLTDPAGNEAGRVRKRNVPAYEAFFYKGVKGTHVIKTDIGNIGVGICYDSWFSFLPRIAQEEDFDLLLLPHSSPTPQKRNHIPQEHIDRFNADVKVAAERYSKLLGIPVILSNKCGKFRSSAPFGPYEKTTFPGLSTITDSNGMVRAQLGNEEGVIVEEVTLDKASKKKIAFQGHGQWAWEGPWQRNIMLIVEFLGRLSYRFSRARKEAARKVEEMGMADS